MPTSITMAQAFRIWMRVESSLNRAEQLVTLSTLQIDEVSVASDDLNRSAVVLLHAALEEFLRSLARLRLPTADRAQLAKIPLVGLGGIGEDRRFTLGHLADHRGAKVDDLIYQSVRSHLERRSFSSIQDVQQMLEHLELSADGVRDQFSALASLMKRRHRVVHQADFATETADGPARWSPDDVRSMVQWQSSLRTLSRTIIRNALDASDHAAWETATPATRSPRTS